jgi:hypothetical protein
VALRAKRGPVDPADTASSLAPGLALPMLHRNVLLGFALLGFKPGGDAYRPDEAEVLAYAAHHIGLDLHALKIEQLERERTELTKRCADWKWKSRASGPMAGRRRGAMRRPDQLVRR